jgi:hypothetical protein
MASCCVKFVVKFSHANIEISNITNAFVRCVLLVLNEGGWTLTGHARTLSILVCELRLLHVQVFGWIMLLQLPPCLV